MSPKNRNKLYLGIFCLLVSCSARFTKNYHDPSFTCYSGSGFRDPVDFEKYRTKGWIPYRLILREDNQRLGKAKVVLVGNSLAHLFLPDLLKKEFPNQAVVNRGIGGDLTDTLLERIDEDVLTLSPSTIIIEIGGNDLIQGKCLSTIQSNMEAILSRIKEKQPNARILVLAVPPTQVPHLNAVVPAYNLFLSGLPKKFKGVDYIEIWDEMRNPDLPTIKDEFVRPRDPIHFNEKGYEVWGKKIRPYL